MNDRARTVWMLVIPAIAVSGVAVGLWVGAPKRVQGARIEVGPSAKGRMAPQITTFVDDRGVRERTDHVPVTLSIRHGTETARWAGESNLDGVAEAPMPLSPRAGESVYVNLTASGVSVLDGDVIWPNIERKSYAGEKSWIPATRNEGPIALDVGIEGARLGARLPGRVWVRARDRGTDARLDGVTLTVEPDAALALLDTAAPTCQGWTSFTVRPEFHVVGATIRAKSAAGAEGTWFGALPVAGGADDVAMPRPWPESTEVPLTVRSLGVAKNTYLEIDDDHGRVFGAALSLVPSASGETSADVRVPPLSAGAYWIVTSRTARGAADIEGGTLARPLYVGPEARGCAERAERALALGRGFDRAVLAESVVRASAARQSGWRAFALGALAIGCGFELVLLFLRWRDANRDLSRVVGISADNRLALLAVGALLTILGFGLLAWLIFWSTLR